MKSKYEILEKAVKSTRDKTINLADVEKVLKKNKAVADDNGNYSDDVANLVVSHFKLAHDKAKSDRALISFLTKQNKELTKKNDELVKELELLKGVKSCLDRLSGKFSDRLDRFLTAYEEQYQQQDDDNDSFYDDDDDNSGDSMSQMDNN